MSVFDLSSREKILASLNGKLVSIYNKQFSVFGTMAVYETGGCSVHSLDRESTCLFSYKDVVRIEYDVQVFTNIGTIVAQIEVL